MNILTDNKETLVTLSELLIEREVLDFADVDSIMKTGELPAVVKVEPEPAEAEPTPSDDGTEKPETTDESA